MTSKMLHEVQKRSQDGNGSAEMAELIEHLKEPSAQKSPVILPLAQQDLTLEDQEEQPGLMTTSSVHLTEALTDEELEELVNWVHSVSRSSSFGLRLECIKRTDSNSMVFIL